MTHPCDEVDNGGCEQLWEKVGAEAKCSCADDFILNNDGSCTKREWLYGHGNIFFCERNEKKSTIEYKFYPFIFDIFQKTVYALWDMF